MLNTGHIKKKITEVLRSGCNIRTLGLSHVTLGRRRESKRSLELTRESQRTRFTFIYINVLMCSLSIGRDLYSRDQLSSL